MADKNVALTDSDRALIRIAINFKKKSIERAMNNEENTDVVKLRANEMESYQKVADKL